MNKHALKAGREDLPAKMGLATEARRRAEKYSSGMKRRLSLVFVLIHDPQIVFLDEPTVVMDPQSRHAV